MPSRGDADTTLCRTFCTYYKPGKTDDLACQGFMVVQGLIAGGRTLPAVAPGELAIPDKRAAAGLQERVCGACSFREQDCDYIATGGTAPSCGGFLVLKHLLGTGEITLKDIGKPVRKR